MAKCNVMTVAENLIENLDLKIILFNKQFKCQIRIIRIISKDHYKLF